MVVHVVQSAEWRFVRDYVQLIYVAMIDARPPDVLANSIVTIPPRASMIPVVS